MKILPILILLIIVNLLKARSVKLSIYKGGVMDENLEMSLVNSSVQQRQYGTECCSDCGQCSHNDCCGKSGGYCWACVTGCGTTGPGVKCCTGRCCDGECCSTKISGGSIGWIVTGSVIAGIGCLMIIVITFIYIIVRASPESPNPAPQNDANGNELPPVKFNYAIHQNGAFTFLKQFSLGCSLFCAFLSAGIYFSLYSVYKYLAVARGGSICLIMYVIFKIFNVILRAGILCVIFALYCFESVLVTYFYDKKKKRFDENSQKVKTTTFAVNIPSFILATVVVGFLGIDAIIVYVGTSLLPSGDVFCMIVVIIAMIIQIIGIFWFCCPATARIYCCPFCFKAAEIRYNQKHGIITQPQVMMANPQAQMQVQYVQPQMMVQPAYGYVQQPGMFHQQPPMNQQLQLQHPMAKPQTQIVNPNVYLPSDPQTSQIQVNPSVSTQPQPQPQGQGQPQFQDQQPNSEQQMSMSQQQSNITLEYEICQEGQVYPETPNVHNHTINEY